MPRIGTLTTLRIARMSSGPRARIAAAPPATTEAAKRRHRGRVAERLALARLAGNDESFVKGLGNHRGQARRDQNCNFNPNWMTRGFGKEGRGRHLPKRRRSKRRAGASNVGVLVRLKASRAELEFEFLAHCEILERREIQVEQAAAGDIGQCRG